MKICIAGLRNRPLLLDVILNNRINSGFSGFSVPAAQPQKGLFIIYARLAVSRGPARLCLSSFSSQTASQKRARPL